MARKKKNYTLDEQLSNITLEIENTETSLEELYAAKKEIEEQIRLNRLNELDKLISESGRSYDEVREMICCAE